jgi:hypothetical protein
LVAPKSALLSDQCVDEIDFVGEYFEGNKHPIELSDLLEVSNNEQVLPYIDPACPFAEEIKKVVIEFKEVFADTLANQKQASKLPKLILEVDTNKWYLPKNSGAARQTTEHRNKEIRDMCQGFLEANLIEMSDATYYMLYSIFCN